MSMFLYSCPHIDLPGDIKGVVTDAETSEPIYQVQIKLDTPDDTTRTGTDGSYQLNNVDPGSHEILASKFGYAPKIENVKVISERQVEKNFSLTKIPTINVSTNSMDFGLDSTSLKFNVSKTGTGVLTYSIVPRQNWITVSPTGGEVTGEIESDIITVTIDKTGLGKRKYIDTIKVFQISGPDLIQEVKIVVFLNGIWIDSKYVNIVRIGTQVWMGENLNIGTRIDGAKDQTDNGKIEKYCYNDGEYNCDIYGGLYQWDEMMQYNPAEDTNKMPGTTQGICPDGWHIPTDKEWRTHGSYVGWDGGKLKETGNIHWTAPNTGATNESGFTALPGGCRGTDAGFYLLGEVGEWWSTCSDWYTHTEDSRIGWFLKNVNANFEFRPEWRTMGFSVRCVRDP
jgi:uncharacterized protein (TIGR02145 family)